jgi:hypothetical protein
MDRDGFVESVVNQSSAVCQAATKCNGLKKAPICCCKHAHRCSMADLKRRSENGTSDFVLKLNSRPPEHPLFMHSCRADSCKWHRRRVQSVSLCSDRANAQFLCRAKTLRDHPASASVRKSQDGGFPAMERLITLFIFGEVNSRAQWPVKKFLPDVVELYSPRATSSDANSLI